MNLLIENKYLTIVFLLIFCGLPLLSQNESDSVKHLREVVVTQDAKRTQNRSTAPLQIIDNEKLASLNARQLSDAVKHFSGVTVKDYGGIGGLKTVSVRRLGANHTAISYDGIPVWDVQTGQIDIGRFSLENVDNISLSIGQTDNIFQPARMFSSASVLNIQTQKPNLSDKQSISGKINLKAGSFGLFNPAFLVNGRFSEIISASFSGEWLSAHGKYPYVLNYGIIGKDSSSVETRKNTDVKNLRLEGTLFADFSDNSKAYLKTYFYNSERGLPGATIYYNTDNFSSQRIWDNNFFAQTHFETRFSPALDFQANAKYNRSFMRYLDPAIPNSTGKIENNYTQQELYGSATARYRVLEKLSFSASSDVYYNQLKADLSNFAFPERLTWLSVLAGKFTSEKLLATVSLLYTQTFEQVKNGNPSENQSKLSPYVSISYKPFETSDLRIRTFYKNIFRLPTFNDLYYTQIGNRKLKPEDTNQTNLGVTYSLSNDSWLNALLFTADAYHNKVKNKIVAYPTKNIFEWTMLNYGTVEINGLDLSADAVLKLSKNVKLNLGGTHTYQRALNKTDATSRNYNHQIPYTPRVSGSAKAGMQTPWFNVNYTMIWSGHRYALGQNFKENRVEGFADHGISLSRDIYTAYGVFSTNLEALNLLNKNYEVVRFFPMPGRSFRATLVWKF